MADTIVQRLKQYLESHVCLDVVDRPIRPSPPCTITAIEAAERDLGFSLPLRLRQIYLEVANGGFGPGYGVMGVKGGFTDDQGSSIVDAYRVYAEPHPEDPAWIWPCGWVPICHWGCAIYSVVDCLNQPYPVYFADFGSKEDGEPMDTILHHHKASLAQWLGDWMDGKDLWKEVWG